MQNKFTPKRSPLKKILISVSLLIILFSAFWVLQFYRYIYKTPLRIEQAGYVVTITPGMSIHKLSALMSKEGVLKHPQWLVWWIQLKGVRKQIKAGEYLIKSGSTPKAAIELFISGKVVQHPLTIVEGWTFDRLLQAIQQMPKLKQTLLNLSHEEIMARLGYPGQHPEGRFFPETYYFPAGTTDVQFLQRAYRLLQEKLDKAFETRDKALSLNNPYETLILASIIEKESSFTEEYSEIAGVYIRRLARNMPLQADPTVIYGLGSQFKPPLTLEQLKKPTAYNTYVNTGLPPTPIAMPSLKAIEAATKPKAGESLYFVATGDEKRHVFSKTLDEHQKAVLRYREALKKLK